MLPRTMSVASPSWLPLAHGVHCAAAAPIAPAASVGLATWTVPAAIPTADAPHGPHAAARDAAVDLVTVPLPASTYPWSPCAAAHWSQDERAVPTAEDASVGIEVSPMSARSPDHDARHD